MSVHTRSDMKNVQANPTHSAAPGATGVSGASGLPHVYESKMPTGTAGRVHEETYTCICCPLGCELTVMLEQQSGGLVVRGVVGYTCRRGKTYAEQEAIHPERMVTVALPVVGRLCPVSAKTQRPIPKNRMMAALEELRAVEVRPPVREGQVLVCDLCGTGVDVVATKSIE